MIGEILAAYLRDNRRIVVPELGAFLRKEGDDSVVFVEFLRKDDGVLEGLLRQRGAGNGTISSFVDDVRAAVDSGAGYVIEGLGTLKKDPSGGIGLSYDPNIRNKEVYHMGEPVVAAKETPAPAAMEADLQSPPQACGPDDGAEEAIQKALRQEADVRREEPHATQSVGKKKSGMDIVVIIAIAAALLALLAIGYGLMADQEPRFHLDTTDRPATYLEE